MCKREKILSPSRCIEIANYTFSFIFTIEATIKVRTLGRGTGRGF